MTKKDKRDLLGRRIAPGIWEDQNGDIHWSITELLEHVDLEDTAANRDKVVEKLKEMMRAQNKDVKLIYRTTKEDPGTEL